MSIILDGFYLLLLVLLSPWLLYKALTTGKYRRALVRRFTGDVECPGELNGRVVWFHGVSVGEIHLLRPVVAGFRQRHPEWTCLISTTTDTGFEEARNRFPDLPVVTWPLDFSWAVTRSLQRINPDLVVLAEGELWPNFLATAKRHQIPVALINGRISPRSHRRAQLLGPLVRPILGRIDVIAAQTEDYASCYRTLGATPNRVHVTGSVKFDGVEGNRQNSRTQALGRLLGLRPDDLIWIAGSTQAPEEQLALDIFRQARATHPNLRLLLVPRQRDRFEEVARLLDFSGLRFVRRSALSEQVIDREAIVLVDSIGELGALWGLADVAFVGGSLDGRRGGQNMIEPAAYGAAVVFGPHVWNFSDTADRLLGAGGAVQVANAAALESAVLRLLDDRLERERLGRNARQFVFSQQGATERTLNLLDDLLQTERRATTAA